MRRAAVAVAASALLVVLALCVSERGAPAQPRDVKKKPFDHSQVQAPCAQCHRDPHGLPVRGGEPSASNRCADCHTTRSFRPATLDAAGHARLFGNDLKGRHETVPCQACHERLRFFITPTACNECHADMHRARFGADCARCHDETGWHHVPDFNHGKETGTALDGAHLGVPCVRCHTAAAPGVVPGAASKTAFTATPNAPPNASPNAVSNAAPNAAPSPGTAAPNPPGALRDCASCHTARHGNQFGADCRSCHNTTRFTDVRKFAHATTGFPLERSHATLACSSCHDSTRFPRISPECRSCHGDPHRGRTLLDCRECHRADNWNVIRYDHDRSEFPLRGVHYVAGCRDCHTADVWTGIRRECISCHRADALRANQLRPSHRMNRISCGDAGCHTPFTW